MSKSGKNRNSVGDLEALINASSPAILVRYIVHLVLCIAALVLGFSISREALLIVVSFRLPYGSLFVKTTTNVNGHEVAIISFPRMKQTRAISRSDFTVSHLVNDRTEVRVPAPTEVSVSTLGKNSQVHAFSEAKLVLQERLPSIYSPHLQNSPRNSRVLVGRHEILIRPWPHPDPLQVVAAQKLMTQMQEEQQHALISKERKMLLVVTPTSSETVHLTGLTCLMHSLRLIRGSVTWIVVETGNASEETAAFLASSKLSFRHLGAHGDSKALVITEALRYIHNQHLEGIVVFAVENIVYNLEFFDRVQKVEWMGAFASSSTVQGHAPAACEDCDKPVIPFFIEDNISQIFEPAETSCNNASIIEACWYTMMRDGFGSGAPPLIESAGWSSFAFNARLLWGDQTVPWIKSWGELTAGNQILVKSPVDLVKNISKIEPLGTCG